MADDDELIGDEIIGVGEGAVENPRSIVGGSTRASLAALAGDDVRFDEPMRRHTTAKIGGPADALVRPSTIERLEEVVRWAAAAGVPLTVVGGVPPRSGCGGRGFGDPHLVTHDGLVYDVQAAGEFLLAANDAVEVQARTEAVAGELSAITAIATEVDGRKVTFENGEPLLRIDGTPLEIPQGGVFFPVCAQGSSVTTSVAPRARSPASVSAAISACGPPHLAWCPRPTTVPSGARTTAPTSGFGSTCPRPRSASSRARRIQSWSRSRITAFRLVSSHSPYPPTPPTALWRTLPLVIFPPANTRSSVWRCCTIPSALVEY